MGNKRVCENFKQFLPLGDQKGPPHVLKAFTMVWPEMGVTNYKS